MEDPIIVAIILITFGSIQAIKTDWFVRFQIWVQKNLMGAEYIPTSKTYKIIRIFGAFLMISGLLILVFGK